jgi:hypothetical protein
LKAWLGAHHPRAILRALPGYEGDEEEKMGGKHGEEEEEDEGTMVVTNGKGRQLKSSRAWAEEDNDCPVTLAGKRVSRCADVWDLLAGHAAETPGVKPRSTREKAIGEEWGWELAEVLIAGYARDAQLHEGGQSRPLSDFVVVAWS